MVHKSFLIVLLTLVLSNCSPKVEPIQIDTKPIEITVAKAEHPTPLALSSIKWKILNIEDTIYYGLTVNDYQLLALNMEDIKKYLTAQQNVINYYENALPIAQ